MIHGLHFNKSDTYEINILNIAYYQLQKINSALTPVLVSHETSNTSDNNTRLLFILDPQVPKLQCHCRSRDNVPTRIILHKT